MYRQGSQHKLLRQVVCKPDLQHLMMQQRAAISTGDDSYDCGDVYNNEVGDACNDIQLNTQPGVEEIQANVKWYPSCRYC